MFRFDLDRLKMPSKIIKGEWVAVFSVLLVSSRQNWEVIPRMLYYTHGDPARIEKFYKKSSFQPASNFPLFQPQNFLKFAFDEPFTFCADLSHRKLHHGFSLDCLNFQEFQFQPKQFLSNFLFFWNLGLISYKRISLKKL